MLVALGLAGMLISLSTHSKEFDQDTALKLTQTGAILPLSDIVKRLHQQHRLHSLKLLEATLHTSRPHPAYLLELMNDDRYVDDICVDALTGQARSLEACHTAKDRPESD